MTARTRLTLPALACVVVSGLLGASAGEGASNEGAPLAAGSLDSDWVHGDFWRPAGSAAVRPALRLERAAWTPPEAGSRLPHEQALTPLRAFVPLAAND